jgi:hypothetical protein
VSALRNTIARHSTQSPANAHARSFAATIRETSSRPERGFYSTLVGRDRYDFAKIGHNSSPANIVSQGLEPNIQGGAGQEKEIDPL